MNANKNNFIIFSTNNFDYDELQIVLKKHAQKTPFQKVISIRNDWKEYANRFEDFMALLPLSTNLYQINAINFLINSKLQPIFPTNLSAKKINLHISKLEVNLKRSYFLDINFLPKKLVSVKKRNKKINLPKINFKFKNDLFLTSGKPLQSDLSPLTYQPIEKLKKQNI